MIVWQAKLTDEETERTTDDILDQMIDDLEIAWEHIKDDHLKPKVD